jgi:hypothetical protein
MQDELKTGNGAGPLIPEDGVKRDVYKVSRIAVGGEVLSRHFDSEQETLYWVSSQVFNARKVREPWFFVWTTFDIAV